MDAVDPMLKGYATRAENEQQVDQVVAGVDDGGLPTLPDGGGKAGGRRGGRKGHEGVGDASGKATGGQV